MARPRFHLAIDLGAASGRAVLGSLGANGLELHEVHRFTYAPRRVGEHLRWDAARLFEGVRAGPGTRARNGRRHGGRRHLGGRRQLGRRLRAGGRTRAARRRPGLLSRRAHVRRRARRVCSRVCRARSCSRAPASRSCRSTPCSSSPHTCARACRPRPRACCSSRISATTCSADRSSPRSRTPPRRGLLAAGTGTWDDELFARLGLPRALMPDIVPAGAQLGTLRHGAASPERARCHPDHRAGDARYGQRRRRHPARTGRRLHLVRHVVARRRRAHGPAPGRSGRARQFHQRGRGVRHGALPEERDGALDPGVLPPRVGAGRARVRRIPS